MRRLIRRPTAAMVVACIALLVALGGTSVAAVSQLARNSVGTPQLRNNAVTTPKMRNGAVTTPKIRNRAVTLAKLAPNARIPGPAGPQGPAGAQGPAGPPGTGAMLAFRIVSGGSPSTTSSTTFVDVPGAATTIDVPAGSTATLLVSFTAESACFAASGWCSVRVLIDGAEADPTVGGSGLDFAFDSSDSNTETGNSWESHAVQRSRANVPAGSHTVTVQYGVVGATTNFRLDDWSLSVLALRQ